MTELQHPMEHGTMKTLDGLNSYEKGVFARALLAHLIKQGLLEDDPNDDQKFEIRLLIGAWHLKILAFFSEDLSLPDESEREFAN